MAGSESGAAMRSALVTVTRVAEVEVNLDWAYSVIASLMPDDIQDLTDAEVAEEFVSFKLQHGSDFEFDTFVSCVTEFPEEVCE